MRTSTFLGRHGLTVKWWFLCDPGQPLGTGGLLLGDRLVIMGVHMNPRGAMMLIDLMDNGAIQNSIVRHTFSAMWACQRQ